MPLPINNDQLSLALTQFFPMSGIYPTPDGDSGGIPLGSIRTFAGSFAFGGSFAAEGQILPILQNTAVFSLLGTTYGGDGRTTYALPDLDGRTMIGVGQGLGLDPVQLGVPVGSSQLTLATPQLPINVGGSNQPFDNYQPSLPIHYLIRTGGVFPSQSGIGGNLFLSGGGNDFMGEIVPFAGMFVPGGFMEAAGQTLQIADYETLFQLIGTIYGGDGVTTFQLPDLRGRTIVGASPQLAIGTAEGLEQSFLSNGNLPLSAGGGGQPIDNHEPSLALNYLISLAGLFPTNDGGAVDSTQQYLGEVVAFAGDFAPRGWALAQGQLLPISQNQALFALLGTQYGGDGRTTFALPDLRDHTAIGTGDTATTGEVLGSNLLTLTSANIPDMHVTGTADANILRGADGNDVLDGAGGADTMIGGLGNDTYFVDNIGDVVTENPGGGTDTVLTNLASYTLPANVENLFGTSATGQALTGNDLDNVLSGGAGADTMTGGLGNDTYVVDNAGDAVNELPGQGTDTVQASFSYRLGTNLENLTLMGTADLQGYGNDLVNTLTGNSGNNLLDGGVGADLMVGGGGNDTYFVDNTGDGVIESPGAGTDTVFASVNFGLPANAEILVLQGSADLQGYGNDLANTLFGNTGNNLLDGGPGADRMVGGGGNDTYFVDDPGDVVVENAGQGTDTVFASISRVMGANLETLVLQGGADLQGYGNGQANTIFGNTGNNLLDGGGGADKMVGGAGDDTYFVDNPGDTVVENAGQGNDSVFASTHFTLPANVENLILQGGADLQGYGNGLVNTIYGNSGNNLLDGGGAADILVGGLGNDVYFVDNSADAVVENPGEGSDAVFSTANFSLSANVEALVLQGSADLQGYGNDLANTIYGNAGNNLIDGGAGGDVMIGGVGNDTYFVDNVGDGVVENPGEGVDAIFSTVDYTLSANVEALVLQGGGNINGTGNALANSLFGNSGDNTLDGGGGADQLTGNAGNDTFVFRVGQGGGDTVVDFAGNGAAVGDSLRFVGYGVGATFTNIDAAHWQVNYNNGASHEVITFMNGASVDASDVVLV
jgi:microcystin-dependent protein